MKPCNPNGRFTVCWDPLDGSSIVDNNWAVGTMIGIWSKEFWFRRGWPPRRHRPRPGHRAHRHLRPPHHRARGSRRWRVRVFLRLHPRRLPAPRRHLRALDLLPQADQDQPRHPHLLPGEHARAVTRWRATRSSSTTTWTRATPSATPAVSCPTCTSSSPRTWASSPTPPRRSPPPSSASRSRRPLRPPRREGGRQDLRRRHRRLRPRRADQRRRPAHAALHRLRQRGRPLQRAGPR